jgi:hypothetical protein
MFAVFRQSAEARRSIVFRSTVAAADKLHDHVAAAGIAHAGDGPVSFDTVIRTGSI